MLQVISIVSLVIGVPMLIIGIFIIGIRKILEIEVIKNFLSKLNSKLSIFNSKIEEGEKKINEFILWFLIFLMIYIFGYPILFILIIRHLIINKNSPEITGKEKFNTIYIFSPLLLIWFAGFFYLLDYFFYGNY